MVGKTIIGIAQNLTHRCNLAGEGTYTSAALFFIGLTLLPMTLCWGQNCPEERNG